MPKITEQDRSVMVKQLYLQKLFKKTEPKYQD